MTSSSSGKNPLLPLEISPLAASRPSTRKIPSPPINVGRPAHGGLEQNKRQHNMLPKMTKRSDGAVTSSRPPTTSPSGDGIPFTPRHVTPHLTVPRAVSDRTGTNLNHEAQRMKLEEFLDDGMMEPRNSILQVACAPLTAMFLLCAFVIVLLPVDIIGIWSNRTVGRKSLELQANVIGDSTLALLAEVGLSNIRKSLDRLGLLVAATEAWCRPLYFTAFQEEVRAPTFSDQLLPCSNISSFVIPLMPWAKDAAYLMERRSSIRRIHGLPEYDTTRPWNNYQLASSEYVQEYINHAVHDADWVVPIVSTMLLNLRCGFVSTHSTSDALISSDVLFPSGFYLGTWCSSNDMGDVTVGITTIVLTETSGMVRELEFPAVNATEALAWLALRTIRHSIVNESRIPELLAMDQATMRGFGGRMVVQLCTSRCPATHQSWLYRNASAARYRIKPDYDYTSRHQEPAETMWWHRGSHRAPVMDANTFVASNAITTGCRNIVVGSPLTSSVSSDLHTIVVCYERTPLTCSFSEAWEERQESPIVFHLAQDMRAVVAVANAQAALVGGRQQVQGNVKVAYTPHNRTVLCHTVADRMRLVLDGGAVPLSEHLSTVMGATTPYVVRNDFRSLDASLTSLVGDWGGTAKDEFINQVQHTHNSFSNEDAQSLVRSSGEHVHVAWNLYKIYSLQLCVLVVVASPSTDQDATLTETIIGYTQAVGVFFVVSVAYVSTRYVFGTLRHARSKPKPSLGGSGSEHGLMGSFVRILPCYPVLAVSDFYRTAESLFALRRHAKLLLSTLRAVVPPNLDDSSVGGGGSDDDSFDEQQQQPVRAPPTPRALAPAEVVACNHSPAESPRFIMQSDQAVDIVPPSDSSMTVLPCPQEPSIAPPRTPTGPIVRLEPCGLVVILRIHFPHDRLGTLINAIPWMAPTTGSRNGSATTHPHHHNGSFAGRLTSRPSNRNLHHHQQQGQQHPSSASAFDYLSAVSRIVAQHGGTIEQVSTHQNVIVSFGVTPPLPPVVVGRSDATTTPATASSNAMQCALSLAKHVHDLFFTASPDWLDNQAVQLVIPSSDAPAAAGAPTRQPAVCFTLDCSDATLGTIVSLRNGDDTSIIHSFLASDAMDRCATLKTFMQRHPHCTVVCTEPFVESFGSTSSCLNSQRVHDLIVPVDVLALEARHRCRGGGSMSAGGTRHAMVMYNVLHPLCVALGEGRTFSLEKQPRASQELLERLHGLSEPRYDVALVFGTPVHGADNDESSPRISLQSLLHFVFSLLRVGTSNHTSTGESHEDVSPAVLLAPYIVVPSSSSSAIGSFVPPESRQAAALAAYQFVASRTMVDPQDHQMSKAAATDALLFVVNTVTSVLSRAFNTSTDKSTCSQEFQGLHGADCRSVWESVEGIPDDMMRAW